jgi:hypothetical protein
MPAADRCAIARRATPRGLSLNPAIDGDATTRFKEQVARDGQRPELRSRMPPPGGVSPMGWLGSADLPLVFHPAATGARWSFTPVGAG